MTKEILFKRWLAGDGDAFGDLFVEFASTLFNLAYRLTGSREDAQDLIQNAVLRALSAPKKCDCADAFFPWMRKIITNLYLDGVRYHNRAGRNRVVDRENLDEEAGVEESENPRDVCEHEEMQERIEQALASLTPPYRTILVLREVEGLSYEEIAEVQEIPLETVRTQLRRARMQLRERLRTFFPSVR